MNRYRGITTAQSRLPVLKSGDLNRSYGTRGAILTTDEGHPDPLSGFLPLMEIGSLLLLSACDGGVDGAVVAVERVCWQFGGCFGPCGGGFWKRPFVRLRGPVGGGAPMRVADETGEMRGWGCCCCWTGLAGGTGCGSEASRARGPRGGAFPDIQDDEREGENHSWLYPRVDRQTTKLSPPRPFLLCLPPYILSDLRRAK